MTEDQNETKQETSSIKQQSRHSGSLVQSLGKKIFSNHLLVFFVKYNLIIDIYH